MRVDDGARIKKLGIKRILIYGFVFFIISFILAILQTSNIRFFGQIPDILLAMVCAVGFILGGEFGCIFGLFCGILIELLGGFGFTLTPVLYVLCGYFCGALVDVILSRNFISFLLFGAACGIIKEIFTLIFFGLSSSEFNFILLFKDLIIGEYLAYLLCIIPLYFTVLGIYLLFKGKDEGSRLVR